MFRSKKKEKFKSIGKGTIVAVDTLPDKMFSNKLLGDGFAFQLSEGKVYAPLSGEITVAFPTGHAFGLKTQNGEEILIHIGIDTVELEGQGFMPKIKQGDKVKQGDLLAEIDLELIQTLGKDSVVIIIFTSGEIMSRIDVGAILDLSSEKFIEY